MYRIDSMYEPMVEALLSARSENRADRWMACVAFWLGRQQIYNVRITGSHLPPRSHPDWMPPIRTQSSIN